MDDVMWGVHVSDNSGMISDEKARLPSLEDGKQYKFPGAWECYAGGKTGLGVRSQGVPPTDVYHLDKSFVRPQSCDHFKPVCLAGVWLS